MESRKADRLALGLLFAGALLFRLIGINWGLANALHHQSYHPDELPIWAVSQRIEPAKLKLSPGFYNYGTLYLTGLRVATDVIAGYGKGIDPKDPAGQWRFISACHLAGRILSALAGAGMAAVLFAIVRRRSNLAGALCAGLTIAIAPGLVVHSRFQTVDVMAAFLLSLSALFALRILDAPGGYAPPSLDRAVRRDALLSGLFAGLSAGTKYTGLLGLLTLWAALALSKRPGWAREALLGTACAVGTMLVTTPGILLDSGRFAADFLFEWVHTRTGHGLEFAGTQTGFLYHIANLFEGVGGLLTLLGLAGLVYAAWRRHAWAVALLAFFVPYYALIGRSEVKFLRYTFPLTIGLAAGFGWAMGHAFERRGALGGTVAALGMLGLGGLDAGGFRSAALYTQSMAFPEPRDEAGAYLKEVGAGKTVGLVSDPWFWTPATYPDAALPRAVGYGEIDGAMRRAANPKVERFVPANPDERFEWDVRLLTERKPEFVTFSNFETVHVERWRATGAKDPILRLQVDRYMAFRAELTRGWRLVRLEGIEATTIPDLMYVRPVIWVWKRKDLP